MRGRVAAPALRVRRACVWRRVRFHSALYAIGRLAGALPCGPERERRFERLWACCVASDLTTMCGICLAYTVAAVAPTMDAANALLPTYVTFCMYFGGAENRSPLQAAAGCSRLLQQCRLSTPAPAAANRGAQHHRAFGRSPRRRRRRRRRRPSRALPALRQDPIGLEMVRLSCLSALASAVSLVSILPSPHRWAA